MSYKKHFHFWGEAVPARDLPSCGETMLQDTRGWLVRHATSFKLWCQTSLPNYSKNRKPGIRPPSPSPNTASLTNHDPLAVQSHCRRREYTLHPGNLLQFSSEWNWTLEKIPLFGFSCEESEFEVTKVQHQHQQKLGNSEFNSIERFLKQLRKLKREHLHVQSDAGCGRRTGAKTNASLRRVRERQRPRVSYTVFFLDIYIESRTTRYDDRQHLQFCG